MKSSEYWQERSEQALLEAERNTNAYLNRINAIYSKTASDIQKDMERIFKTYQKDFTRQQAEAWLREDIPMDEYNRLKALLPSIQDEKYKAELTMRLNAQSYRYRIGRQEYLRQDILSRLSVAADREKAISAGCYRDTLRQSYNRTMFDIQKGVGIGFRFNQIPEKTVQKLLNAKWYGQSFSESVWQNRESVAAAAADVVKEGVLAGHGIDRMAKALKEQTYTHSMSNAARLVRTEVNYFSNQGAKMSYEEAGLDEYDFLATLDLKTSEPCREHDGKRFLLDKAEPGENYPPLHPWCRSTVAPVINVPGVKRMEKRAARDSENGKTVVIGNMNYSDWAKKYVDTTGKSAIIEAKIEDTHFAELLNKQKGMSPEYATALQARFSSGSRAAKKAFGKYVPENSVENYSYSNGAYYLPRTKKVTMNFSKDAQNPQGAGVTWFHEHGHLIDHYAGGVSVANDALLTALNEDYKSYLAQTKKEHALKRVDDVRAVVSKELRGPEMSSVSDLFGGLSDNKCVGDYGHWGKDYWKRVSPAKEAFAEMYEAQYDPSREAIMKKYFPTAIKEFEKILEMIT